MRTTIEHDEPSNQLPGDTAVGDTDAASQTTTSTDMDVATAFVATATDTATNAAGAHSPYRQSDAPWIAVALTAVVTLVVASLAWLSGPSREPTSTSPVVPDAAAETTVDSIEAVQRQAEQGYVPQQATNREQAITDELVRLGIVPSGRFDDPTLRDLQNRGLVPNGTKVDEDEASRDLRTRWLVPSGRFDDAVLRDLQSRGLLPTTRTSG